KPERSLTGWMSLAAITSVHSKLAPLEINSNQLKAQPVGVAADIRESGCDLFQPLQNYRFGLYADNAVQFSASLKQQQGRNALDTEACRRGRISIYMELRHAHAARHFRG